MRRTGARDHRQRLRLALGPGGAQAGLEAQQPLLDVGESPGGLRAAVEAGRVDRGGHGAPHKVAHPLARVLVEAALREQGGDPLEALFVTFSVTFCGV